MQRCLIQVDRFRAEDTLYPLPDAWLDDIASERRNVVQLSQPRVAVGTSANDVLDRVFARQLIDPAKVSREFISKTRLLARIKRQIRDEIPEEQFVERPVLLSAAAMSPRRLIARSELIARSS